MGYFDRQHADHYRDHVRDLLKHSWPAAEVLSKADPVVPGLIGHLITGYTAQDVQAEINRLRDNAIERAGEYHFTKPLLVRGRYVAGGHTWFGRI